ncbi:MAG: PEP-CTERM sorting domain-containing protein [Fimbriimonadia bacterium]|nr:PEP-CTERM sorting domain-containing protein [Fimbriimonadia bacterium]
MYRNSLLVCSSRSERLSPTGKRHHRVALTTLLSALLIPAALFAQPSSPVYFQTFHDAVTGTNSYNHSGQRYWYVTPGADKYQNDVYERPTVQNYANRGGHYSTHEYFEYLDITRASVGFDSQFLYVSISMFGRNKSTSDGTNSPVGLVERYGFRFGADPNGRNSRLLVVDQPELASSPNTVFSRLKTFGYRDTNGDVGGRGVVNGGATGLNVTKSDNPLEESGMTGYNQGFISDGRLSNNTTVLWARIAPGDVNTVEMALDYVALGLNVNDLMATQYLEFEAIKGGPKDPANYLWNDKYTKSEAGSPNPGMGGLSEFGTQGLGNIYELDTLRGGYIVPEPSTMAALSAGLALMGLRRKRNKK